MLNDSTSQASSNRLSITGWSCLAAVWISAVLGGFAVVVNENLTPGEVGTVPRRHPVGIASPPASDRPLLLVFAHPRCPCTKATIDELSGILTACPGVASVRVFFRTPHNPSEEWTTTALWDDATALPETIVMCDPGGALAAMFGVKTSGHVLLYGGDGQLLFSGGITGARGHPGDNAGRRAVAALLAGRSGQAPPAAVFGCPLFEPPHLAGNGRSCPAQ